MKHPISAFALCLFFSLGAHGSTIVSVQPVTAFAGGASAFDVSLTNTGPSALTVGAFTFGISTTDTAVSFTDANTSTVLDPYIFAGHSLFGPDLTGPSSGQSLSVSDVFATPASGTTVASGATFDLGHILFTVAPNAGAGAFPVSLQASPATSLSDALGDNIPVNTLSNGAITVSSAPEPASWFLVIAGIFFLTMLPRRRLGSN